MDTSRALSSCLPASLLVSAKINKDNDGESHEDYGGNKTAPDESVDHVFGALIVENYDYDNEMLLLRNCAALRKRVL